MKLRNNTKAGLATAGTLLGIAGCIYALVAWRWVSITALVILSIAALAGFTWLLFSGYKEVFFYQPENDR